MFKLKQRGYSLPTIVMVIAVLLLGVGGYFFSRNNTTSPKTQASPVSSQDQITDTSSWTIYTNKTFGYSLKFPATYQVPVQTEKEKSQLGVDNNIGVEKKSDPNGSSVIIIDVSSDKDNLSLKDYMNNNLKMFAITGPLISYNFNGYDSLFNKNQPGTNVFIKSGNNIYHITAPTASTDKEIGDIVATFKFTDQTTNWKTYNNSEFFYKLKYPSEFKAEEQPQSDVYLSLVSFKNTDNNVFSIQVRKSSKEEEIKFQKSQIEGHLPVELTTEMNILVDNLVGTLFDYTPENLGKGKRIRLIIVSNKQYSYTISGDPEMIVKISPTFEILNQESGQSAPTSSEISGFPIYPGAKFLKKKITDPCTGNELGFSLCGSATYSWVSYDADKVWEWYSQDKANSGWKMSGGAGSRDNPQNYGGESGFKKGDLMYSVSWSAQNNKVYFTLAIPRV